MCMCLRQRSNLILSHVCDCSCDTQIKLFLTLYGVLVHPCFCLIESKDIKISTPALPYVTDMTKLRSPMFLCKVKEAFLHYAARVGRYLTEFLTDFTPF